MTAALKAIATRDADAATATLVRSRAAERQSAYRQRRKRAAIDAIGYEADASRVTLLNMLRHDLTALEARTTTAPMLQASRNSAKRILKVILTRYEIEL